MRYHAAVPLFAAVANLGIAVAVLRQGAQQRVNRVFAAMTLAIVSWNLAIFALDYFPDEATAEFWNRIFRTGICLAPVLVYHMGVALIGQPGRATRSFLIAGYVLGGLLVVANVAGVLVSGLNRHSWGWYIEPTPYYSALTIVVLGYLVLSAQVVWSAYRHPQSSRMRVQAKFWLLAMVVPLPFVLSNFAAAYGVPIYPLGSLGNVVYVGIVAYAIVRHRVMDVDYLVRKLLSFSLAAVAVLVPGAVGVMVLSAYSGAKEPLPIAVAATTLALVSAVLIPTLQRALETRIQKAFFPQRYDYRRRLRQFATTLVHELDEAQMLRRLGDTLTEILELEHCHVFARDDQTRQLLLAHPAPASPQALDEASLRPFEQLTGPILASELESADPAAAALFRDRSWEVGIPLRVNDRLIGLIALGPNKHFRFFSAEDLQLLATVAAGASVALENSRLSRELRRSEVVLQRASKLSSLGMLAAGIAHEIRNPLVAVKTFLDLLPQRLDDREFLSTFRELSQSELRRVTDLIADLLALGKSTSAERRAVEVSQTLEPVARLMDSTARKRRVELVTDIAAGLPPIWADGDQIKQIVLNLILNAIDASPAGSQVTLAVRARDEGMVAIEIRDCGAGIPRENLESIFEPFFTTKETGTGLGLCLVHQMVVEHGGEISVESEVGRGTVFLVTLPFATVELRRTGS